jgi:UDP-N-acetylmuramoyl-L-alanine---L-glutamate ligase
MISLIKSVTRRKKVLILGYGREGKSSLSFIRDTCPGLHLTVADSDQTIIEKNPELKMDGIKVVCGEGYLDQLNIFDLIIKSPGVSLRDSEISIDKGKISSQTDLFLRAYSPQIIGVTGTKGKSTTASLIFHILKMYTENVLFAGNIGVPLFNLISEINPETRIVCELSSHQLEHITRGPHIAVLLNLFQEHLDHYNSFYDYQMAKLQAGLKQSENDYFIWTSGDINTRKLLKQHSLRSRLLPVYRSVFEGDGIGFSGENIVLRLKSGERILTPINTKCKLKGEHNQINISIAAASASLMNIPAEVISGGISSFNPLEHRIEYVGKFNNRLFYNDSISTIPEATIAAINTLEKVDTLILGGFDRGIDYSGFIKFLRDLEGTKLVFTGPAGKRIMEEFLNSGGSLENTSFTDDFRQAVYKAILLTPEHGTCLLSPAAASYDHFKSFEERGRCFKTIVME